MGNIAPGMGTVKVEPSKPVRGDRNVTFKVTFTAAGRMVTNETTGDPPIFTDRAGIQIQFPFAIAHEDIKSVTGGGVAFTSGAGDDTEDDVAIDGTSNVNITIPHLLKGQTIVLTTNPIDIGADVSDVSG